MNETELLQKWADYFLENPHELQRLCDRIYALMIEEVHNQRERAGSWISRL